MNQESGRKSEGEGGAGPLDLRMWVRLLGCAKIIEKQLRRNFQDRFDTTLPRFDVMAALDRAVEGLTMGALSRALLVSNGNVTAIVRQLQDLGMVVSRPDRAERSARQRRADVAMRIETGGKRADMLDGGVGFLLKRAAAGGGDDDMRLHVAALERLQQAEAEHGARRAADPDHQTFRHGAHRPGARSQAERSIVSAPGTLLRTNSASRPHGAVASMIRRPQWSLCGSR